MAKNESLTKATVLEITANYPLANVSNPPAINLPVMKSRSTGHSRGGNYQSTSQSFIDAYLARKRRDEIDRLMAMLLEWMDSPNFKSSTAGATGSSSQASLSSGTSSTPGKINTSGQKRARRRDSLDGSGGDGNEDDKHGSKRTRVEQANSPKLACPFFKRDPQKYANRQACTGPGYTMIARLK